MCQKVFNAILIVAPKYILVGPLYSISSTGLVLLVLEMQRFKAFAKYNLCP